MKVKILYSLTFIALILAFTFNLEAQTLKGYTLGEQVSYPANKDGSPNHEAFASGIFEKKSTWSKPTTVAGIKGQISALLLKDGRIFSIIFTTRSDEDKTFSNEEFKDIGNAIENNYNVKLNPINSKDLTMITYRDSSQTYVLLAFLDPLSAEIIEIIFYVRSPKLAEIYESEEQAKRNSDF